MNNILEVKNLHKSFKKNFFSSTTHVLKGLNFTIPTGSVTGFLGANGSGKTTTFKCLLDLIKKDKGEVLFFGSKLTTKNKSHIGFLPERVQLYEDLTASEYLLFLAQLSQPFKKSDLQTQHKKWLKKMDLYSYRDKKLKTFSKGMIQKVGFIQSLVPNPKILILDEPFSGLDPDGRFQVMNAIEEMKEKGLTIFLSSHILQDVERVCNRLLILKQGSVIFEGDYSMLPKNKQENYSIVYIQNGKKQSAKHLSQQNCQKKLKDILLEGASVLSVSSAGSNLEQVYQEMALNKGNL